MVRNPAQKAATLVRALMKVYGAGTYMFNDRLKDGRRSIKVWGWSNIHWRGAVEVLREHGFEVEPRGYLGKFHRIWVSNKA